MLTALALVPYPSSHFIQSQNSKIKQASQVVLVVKSTAANAGDTKYVDQENLLKNEMAIHSSILAWRISCTEEPVCYSKQGHKELDTTEAA